MKIGDKVRPMGMVTESNKKHMFDDEIGTIIEATSRDDGHLFFVVKRDRDGEIFKGIDRLWKDA